MTATLRSTAGLAVVAGLAIFCGQFGVFLVPLQIGAMMDGVGLTSSQSGGLGAIEISFMSLTAIALAPLLDKWRYSAVAIVGAVIAAAGEFLTAMATGLPLLFLLRIIVGIGCGCLFGAATAACAATSKPESNYAWALTVMNSLFIVLYLVIPFALEAGEHRGLFLLLGAILLIAAPVFTQLPSLPASAGQARVESGPVVRRRVIVLYVVATILFNAGMGALWGFVERIGANSVGLPVQTIATILSLGGVFMILGTVLAGVIGHRFGRVRPIVTALVICAIAAATVAYSDTRTTYALGLFAYNAAYLFSGPYIITGLSAALDPSGRLAAAIGGTFFLSYSAGIALAGYIVEVLPVTAIGWLALVNCCIAAPMYYLVCRDIALSEARSAETLTA